MDKETLLRLAKEAGFEVAYYGTSFERGMYAYNMQIVDRFAALVAAHEREEAAKLCDEYAKRSDNSRNYADLCAAAIRARGES